MINLRRKTVLACILLELLPAANAAAMDGNRLIWVATKTAENSYKFRTGIRWPADFGPATGAEMQVRAGRGRDIQAVPVALWANVRLRDEHNGVEDRDLQLQARLDMESRDDSLFRQTSLRYYDSYSWIATPRAEMKSTQSVAVHFRDRSAGAVEATQTLSMALPDWGLSMIASATGWLATRTCTASLRFESRLTAHWTFTAGLTNLQRLAQERVPEPDMRMRLSYSRRW